MPTTWTEVTNLDASLTNTPVLAQDAIIADCYQILNASRWGDKLDLAVKYLAAHTGLLLKRGAATGPLTSEHLGDASQSYAAFIMNGMNDLDLTVWGLRFKFLQRGLVATLGFVA